MAPAAEGPRASTAGVTTIATTHGMRARSVIRRPARTSPLAVAGSSRQTISLSCEAACPVPRRSASISASTRLAAVRRANSRSAVRLGREKKLPSARPASAGM